MGIPLASIAAEDDRDLARQRQDMVDAILTSERPESVAGLRWACFNGDEPHHVRQSRGGFDFIPEAADGCLAALKRKGKDHALLERYRRLILELHANPDAADRLPKAIGNAVLSGNGTVSLGDGKGVKADPALAFDADSRLPILEWPRGRTATLKSSGPSPKVALTSRKMRRHASQSATHWALRPLMLDNACARLLNIQPVAGLAAAQPCCRETRINCVHVDALRLTVIWNR